MRYVAGPDDDVIVLFSDSVLTHRVRVEVSRVRDVDETTPDTTYRGVAPYKGASKFISTQHAGRQLKSI